ncbi:unnamed protein product [Sympodiomycopsis kandeliae]
MAFVTSSSRSPSPLPTSQRLFSRSPPPSPSLLPMTPVLSPTHPVRRFRSLSAMVQRRMQEAQDVFGDLDSDPFMDTPNVPRISLLAMTIVDLDDSDQEEVQPQPLGPSKKRKANVLSDSEEEQDEEEEKKNRRVSTFALTTGNQPQKPDNKTLSAVIGFIKTSVDEGSYAINGTALAIQLVLECTNSALQDLLLGLLEPGNIQIGPQHAIGGVYLRLYLLPDRRLAIYIGESGNLWVRQKTHDSIRSKAGPQHSTLHYRVAQGLECTGSILARVPLEGLMARTEKATGSSRFSTIDVRQVAEAVRLLLEAVLILAHDAVSNPPAVAATLASIGVSLGSCIRLNTQQPLSRKATSAVSIGAGLQGSLRKGLETGHRVTLSRLKSGSGSFYLTIDVARMQNLYVPSAILEEVESAITARQLKEWKPLSSASLNAWTTEAIFKISARPTASLEYVEERYHGLLRASCFSLEVNGKATDINFKGWSQMTHWHALVDVPLAEDSGASPVGPSSVVVSASASASTSGSASGSGPASAAASGSGSTSGSGSSTHQSGSFRKYDLLVKGLLSCLLYHPFVRTEIIGRSKKYKFRVGPTVEKDHLDDLAGFNSTEFKADLSAGIFLAKKQAGNWSGKTAASCWISLERKMIWTNTGSGILGLQPGSLVQ